METTAPSNHYTIHHHYDIRAEALNRNLCLRHAYNLIFLSVWLEEIGNREGKSHSIEQAPFSHRPGQTDCFKVSDDFAGAEIAQLRVFDSISFLIVTIESKAVFDVTNVLSIFIKMTP
jgi:hypothetical protein